MDDHTAADTTPHVESSTTHEGVDTKMSLTSATQKHEETNMATASTSSTVTSASSGATSKRTGRDEHNNVTDVHRALSEIRESVFAHIKFSENGLKDFDEHVEKNLTCVDDLNQLVESMRVDRERLEAMILPELIDSAKDLQSVFHAIEVVEELIDELYDATKRASDRLQELQNVENSRRPKGFSKMFRSFKIKKNRPDIQPLEVPDWDPKQTKVNIDTAFAEIDDIFLQRQQTTTDTAHKPTTTEETSVTSLAHST